MSFSELIVVIARKGAALGEIEGAKMCNDCAFKPGTEPQKDPVFMDYLGGRLSCGSGLECHISDDGEEGENKLCAGFLYFKQYFDSLG